MRGIAMAIMGATWLWQFRKDYDAMPKDKDSREYTGEENGLMGFAISWFLATLFVIAMGW